LGVTIQVEDGTRLYCTMELQL